jgi:hypothetical protein
MTFFDWDEKSAAFHARPALPVEGSRLFSDCGFFSEDRYYQNTDDPVQNLQNALSYTVLVDLKSGERNQLGLKVDAAFLIPKTDLRFIWTDGGEHGDLLSDTGTAFSIPQPPKASFHASFTHKNALLLWSTTQVWHGNVASDFPLAWDLSTGEADLVKTIQAAGFELSLSADGSRAAYVEKSDNDLQSHIAVSDFYSGTVVARFPVEDLNTMYSPSLDAHGAVLTMLASNTRLEVYRVADKKLMFSLPIANDDAGQLMTALNPQGDLLAVAIQAGVTVYQLSSGHIVAAFPAKRDGINFQTRIEFSPDGAWLAIARSGYAMRLIATRDWKGEKQLSPVQDMPFSFSPDAKRIAYAEAGVVDPDVTKISWMPIGSGLTVNDVATGKKLYSIASARLGVSISPTFSADGRILAVETGAGMQLLNADSGELLATLYVFDGDADFDWLAVMPNGLFDGSPNAWRRVHWRFNGNSFEIAPVESFFREFYHPGLLAEIVDGKHLTAPRDISNIDRRQPEIHIAAVDASAPMNRDHVHIDIDVTESRVAVMGAPKGSGTRDLRLFRNGTLVHIWRGDLPLDKDGHTRLSADIPIVEGVNQFTAYAFNLANIKSADATLVITGSDKLARKGTAYVFAIGINRYTADTTASPMNLNFAEADATDFYEQFAKNQNALRQFSEVKPILLLSADATRSNILAVLSILGGGSRDSLTPSQQKMLAGLNAVRPEDGVFIFYAGHGAMDEQQTHFYLLPNDFDPTASLDMPASQSISEADLSVALAPISASRSFLIIDACHSGKAIDAERVGPMNATGLAQLAYEKGMYILAASQDRESALEAPQLAGGHGYLTFALVEEGLKTSDAAQNGVVELRPWFEYATHRVPELEGMLLADPKLKCRAFGTGDNPCTTTAGERQHPRMFYRREPETSPFVIARPAGAQHPSSVN